MRIVSSLLIAAALAACAAAPDYRSAAGARDYGYSDLRIERDRYRITYRAPGGAEAAALQDGALLRAAEITLAQGYQWFEVLDRRAQAGRAGGPRPTGGLGVSIGSGGYSGVGVGLGVSLGGGAPAEEVIEVRLGSGEPRPERAYDAGAVAATLGARLRPGG